MGDIQIGEIVRVVISYGAPGASIAQNVFYYENSVTSADEQTTLANVNSHFASNWLDRWSDNADASASAFLLEMDIVNGDGTVDRNIGDADPQISGGITGDILPAAVSGYMQANTERSNSLGRKFVPFLTETAQTDGFWESTVVTALADMLVDWLTPIVVDTTATLIPGVVSRVTQLFLEFLGSGYSTNVPAYQRRRKPTVGS